MRLWWLPPWGRAAVYCSHRVLQCQWSWGKSQVKPLTSTPVRFTPCVTQTPKLTPYPSETQPYSNVEPEYLRTRLEGLCGKILLTVVSSLVDIWQTNDRASSEATYVCVQELWLQSSVRVIYFGRRLERLFMYCTRQPKGWWVQSFIPWLCQPLLVGNNELALIRFLYSGLEHVLSFTSYCLKWC